MLHVLISNMDLIISHKKGSYRVFKCAKCLKPKFAGLYSIMTTYQQILLVLDILKLHSLGPYFLPEQLCGP